MLATIQNQQLANYRDLKNSNKLIEKFTKTEVELLDLHFETKKLRNFNESEIDKCAQMVNSWVYAVGVREPLRDSECLVLLRFLKDIHPDFSISEIKKACNLYAGGKLDFFESHYQVFSNDFLTKILIAFRTYKNKIVAKYHRMNEYMESTKEPNEEEKERIEREFMEVVLFEPYQSAIENGTVLRLDEINASMCFKKFYKLKLISVNKDEARKFREKAVEEMKKPKLELLSKEKIKEINYLIQRLNLVEVKPEDDPEMESKVKSKSSALFFVNWVNKEIDKKTDLKKMYYEAKA